MLRNRYMNGKVVDFNTFSRGAKNASAEKLEKYGI